MSSASRELLMAPSIRAFSRSLLLTSLTERRSSNSVASSGWFHSGGGTVHPDLKTLPA